MRVDRVDRRRVRDQGIPLGAVRDHGPAQVTQLGLGLVLGVIVGLVAIRRPSCLSLHGGHRVLTLRVLAALALTGQEVRRALAQPEGIVQGRNTAPSPVLLTREQTLTYELPAAEGKHDDPRWPAFARRYGFDVRQPVQWEVEALEPAELQRLVLEAVEPYIDRAQLARQLAEERRQRRRLAEFLGRFGDSDGS